MTDEVNLRDCRCRGRETRSALVTGLRLVVLANMKNSLAPPFMGAESGPNIAGPRRSYSTEERTLLRVRPAGSSETDMYQIRNWRLLLKYYLVGPLLINPPEHITPVVHWWRSKMSYACSICAP